MIANSALAAGYRLLAELLLHPDERDRWRIAALRRCAAPGPAEVMDRLDAFLASPAAWSADEYVATLELAPPCPLYLGAYLFDEPSTCRDVGTSGRNAYMIELGAIYRHFGYALAPRELPDFAPAVFEFLALSLDRSERDTIGLRRRLVRRLVLPALPRFRAALERRASPYAHLLAAAEALCRGEVAAAADSEPPGARVRSLAVLAAGGWPARQEPNP